MNKEQIKRSIKKFFKVPMLWVLLVIAICFGSVSFAKSAEINTYAIVTALGIDQADDMIELSLLTFVPIVEQNFKDSYKIITAKGKTINEALNYASVHVGRRIGLSHIKTLVVNADIFKSGAAKTLDFLARSKELSLSTSLICTDKKALDFLEVVQQLDNSGALKIENVVNFNKKYVAADESTIESFFKGVNSKSKASIVSFMTLDENEGLDISGQSGGGDSSSSQSSSNSPGKMIKNSGDCILCKDGKLVKYVASEDVEKINYLRGGFEQGQLVLENCVSDMFKDTTLTFKIYNNSIMKEARFVNGIPLIYLDVKLNVKLVEVNSNKANYDIEFDDLPVEIIKDIRCKVKEMITDGLAILRETKCDIIGVYEFLNNNNYGEFKRFLNKLDDKDDYLSKVLFKVSPNIYAK